MREVYASMEPTGVSIRQAMLEEAGIPTFVRNEALSNLAEILVAAFQPALCVVNDDQYDEAMKMLRTLGTPQEGLDWVCPRCKESVPASFDSCWKCEALRPGSSL